MWFASQKRIRHSSAWKTKGADSIEVLWPACWNLQSSRQIAEILRDIDLLAASPTKPKAARSLGFQSRHMVDRIKNEAIRVRCPDFADVFVGCEAAERLQPAGEVGSC